MTLCSLWICRTHAAGAGRGLAQSGRRSHAGSLNIIGCMTHSIYIHILYRHLSHSRSLPFCPAHCILSLCDALIKYQRNLLFKLSLSWHKGARKCIQLGACHHFGLFVLLMGVAGWEALPGQTINLIPTHTALRVCVTHYPC